VKEHKGVILASQYLLPALLDGGWGIPGKEQEMFSDLVAVSIAMHLLSV